MVLLMKLASSWMLRIEQEKKNIKMLLYAEDTLKLNLESSQIDSGAEKMLKENSMIHN